MSYPAWPEWAAQQWHDAPLNGTLTRSAAVHPESAIHVAADKHLRPMLLAIRAAFSLGRKSLGNPPNAVRATEAVHAALLKVLPTALLGCAVSGGRVAVESLGRIRKTRLKAAGDVGGHPFHGNQWTEGTGEGRQWNLANKPTLTGETHPHFIKAVKHLRETNPSLLDEVHAIHLVPGTSSRRGGYATKSRQVNLWHGHLKTPAALVQTLAHELTHARQEREGRPFSEAESHKVGVEARKAFLKAEARSNKLRFGAAELRTAKGPAALLQMRFDVTNPLAVKWVKEHAAELAKGLSETTEQDIRDAIAKALDGGGIADAMDEISEAVGSDARATLIARTEIMWAAHEGQQQGWDQAISEGLLNGDERVVWIATEGACDICTPLDGMTRPIDGNYDDPDAADGPPQHPACRCDEGVIS